MKILKRVWNWFLVTIGWKVWYVYIDDLLMYYDI